MYVNVGDYTVHLMFLIHSRPWGKPHKPLGLATVPPPPPQGETNKKKKKK